MNDSTARTQVKAAALAAVAALTLVGSARATELDSMSPEHFTHYAKSRLKTLAASARSTKKVAEEFDERCLTNPDPTRRSSDCEVAQQTHQHLDELRRQEREVMDHLRRDGDVDHSWVAREDGVFWKEMGGSPPRPR